MNTSLFKHTNKKIVGLAVIVVLAALISIIGAATFANASPDEQANNKDSYFSASDVINNPDYSASVVNAVDDNASDSDNVSNFTSQAFTSDNNQVNDNSENEANVNTRPTDVERSDAGEIILWTDANFSTMGKQAAVDRLNALRYEACAEHVRDPRNESRNLDLSDYKPIKWSTDMEWIAQTRAAEGCFAMSHDRPTGKSCFTCTHNGKSSCAEDLAWNPTGMAQGIEQWYSEKYDWVHQTGQETGHYTSMIDPDHTYFGLGTAKVPTNYYYTTAGEFNSGTGLDEAETPEKGQYKQAMTFQANAFSFTSYYPTTMEARSISQIGMLATLKQETSVQFPVKTNDLDYESSDTSVAEVNEYGYIWAKKAGTTTVSISKESTLEEYEYTLTVTPSTRPEATATATGDGQVTLNWTAIAGASKYAVSEVVGSSFKEINYNVSGTSYVVDDLANKVEHTFLVQAYVNGQWSKYDASNYASATPDGYIKPYNITHVSGSNSIQLNWGKVSGATAYAVSIKKADGTYDIKTTSIAQPSKGINTVTYIVSGLADSTQYNFLIQAFVNGKWSSYTEADLHSASTKNIKPTATAVATENDGEIKVSWHTVEGATQYACSEYLGNGKFDVHIVGTDLQYIASDLVAQREHKFLVQAYVAGTWSSYTEADFVGATPTGPIKPTNIDATPGATSIQLDWDKVPGATKYAVAIRNADKTYKLLSTSIPKSDNPTFTASGLKDSTEYTFLVQAFVDGSWSRYVEEDHVVASTISIKPQASAVATENDGEIKVSWQAVENATQYACSEYLGNGKFDIHIVGTDLQYIASDLVAQREHKFLVQAYVAGSWSSYTEEDYVGATPTGAIKPTNITTTPGYTSIQLDWDKVPGATKYAVALRNNDKTYKLLSTSIPKSDNPTFTASGLKGSTEYTFLVQAFVDGSWSRYVETDHVVESTISTKPQATAEATQNDGEIKVSWLPVENATQYACSEYLGDGKFDVHIVGTDLQYIASDLVAQREHKFLVQAYVAGGWSPYTEADFVGATPTGAVKPVVTVTSTAETTVMVTWTAVTGTEQYAASISADGGSTFKSYFIDKGTFTYTFNGLTPNTNYKVLVQSKLMGKWNPYTAADLVDAKTLKTKSAVAVYSETNSSLTFYYDRNDHSTEGEVFAVNNNDEPSWYSKNSLYKTATFDASFSDFRPVTTRSWFGKFDTEPSSKLTTINGLNYLNTSCVTNMREMFLCCNNLTSLDVTKFDTSNVTSMVGMFCSCSKLTSLDVSKFNTSKVKNIDEIFNQCSSLSSLDVTNFDTSNVESMGMMFAFCSGLTTLDVSNFNTSNVIEMRDMFGYCTKLKELNIKNFNVNKVKAADSMFGGCAELTSIYCNSNWSKISTLASGKMFDGCVKLPHFDSSKVDKTYAYPNNGTTGYFTAKA